MAEKKIQWTKQQQRAITARGSDVLVTASAGTGKTEVLSGRCAGIVSDKSVCPDVGSILVLTFTDMAAEQMRCRIAEQLRAEFLKRKDPHLREQLMLLPGADISTIHSFCKRLITEYFYKLALDPTFGVIDSDEATLLKAEVLEKTIDWAWRQSHLRQALEQLLYRRDLRTNDGFLARIIDLSDFLDSVVSREDWCERASRLAETADPLTAELGSKQKQIISDRLQRICSELRHAQRLYETASPQGDWPQKCRDTMIGPIERCIELLESGKWDKCAEEIRTFAKPWVTKPKDVPQPLAELIRKTAKKAIDSFAKLPDLALLNPDYLDRVSASAGLQTKVLVELVKKFDRLYTQAKQAINCLDFADLEHNALKLLMGDGSSEDNLIPSETALALRRRYKYIFVDEYQDINPVQRAILDMLGSPGNGVVVGDVKQSIYAFRGSEPEIFMKDLTSASADAADASSGLRVDLNANFRSAKGILDFVNAIFSRIMTGSHFAGIEYDDSAQLKPARADVSGDQVIHGTGSVVEFHILDETRRSQDSQSEEGGEASGDEDLNVVSSRRRQAAMIVQRIRQMVGADTGKSEFQIYDKEQACLRDVQYRDIVVLMRSLAKKANDYVEILRLAGIPVSCQATAGYFEATEISDVVALLKVLDNPQQDIELTAVLRSPFFKVSDTELAKIKIHANTSRQPRNYYDCLLHYCDSGPDARLTDRLRQNLQQIEQWRTVARRGKLADLIWQIYRQTNFLSFVSALPSGQARRANLLKLHDRAIQFEGFASSGGIPSLTRFVQFIERLLEVGQDWAPAEPESAAGNAVRILSVHKSKGLEFPVVFLAELESRFNMADIRADVVVSAAETLGLQIIDRRSNSKLRSLAHQVIAEQKLSRALAEEMRILYVATTRARDRLILTASQPTAAVRDIIRDGFYSLSIVRDAYCVKGNTEHDTSAELVESIRNTQYAIRDWQLRACQSPLEWILYSLSDRRILHSAFETGLAEQAVDDGLFDLILYRQPDLEQLSRFVLALRASALRSVQRGGDKKKLNAKRYALNAALKAQIKESLSWQYRFSEAPLLPAKSSVTELTHRSDEYVKFDYSTALQRQPVALLAAEGRSVASSSAAWGWLGTATHLVIAELDLTQPIAVQAVTQTVQRLLADGAITTNVAQHIDTASILAFFHSDLGRLALDKENTVWREWPFTFALPAYSSCVVRDEYCVKANLQYDTRGEPVESIRNTQYAIRDTMIVQGIIDMLIQTPQGLVVIDFKTDNVTAKQVAERAELYRHQLDYYSRAASAILNQKLLGKWLYFLTPASAMEV
jgi:ATP-dependent helicase/nuclease subunit A